MDSNDKPELSVVHVNGLRNIESTLDCETAKHDNLDSSNGDLADSDGEAGFSGAHTKADNVKDEEEFNSKIMCNGDNSLPRNSI